MTGEETSSALALRFGAARLCLWTLCGLKTCRRARACKGDPRRCMGLLRSWIGAVDEEKRVRGRFAPLERDIATLAEAKAYLAWHEAIERGPNGVPTDPDFMDAPALDRFRAELTRRLKASQAPHGQDG